MYELWEPPLAISGSVVSRAARTRFRGGLFVAGRCSSRCLFRMTLTFSPNRCMVLRMFHFSNSLFSPLLKWRSPFGAYETLSFDFLGVSKLRSYSQSGESSENSGEEGEYYTYIYLRRSLPCLSGHYTSGLLAILARIGWVDLLIYVTARYKV